MSAKPARGRGRPALVAGEEAPVFTMRMTPALRDKLQRLGGAAWIRDRIAKAKEPAACER
jgi:hypothetical protein